MRLDWKAVLGMAITVLLMWWAFSRVAIGDVWNEILGADLWWLLAAVAVTTFGFLIRAMRWKILLHSLRPEAGLHSRFAAVSVGFMVNNVLPVRIGEFARAFALSRVEPVTASGAFGTIVVERLLDGLTLLTFLFVVVNLGSFPAAGVLSDGLMGAAVDAFAVVLGALLAGVLLLLLWPAQVIGLLEWISARLPGRIARVGVEAVRSFASSLQVLRSPKQVVLALLWTVGFWTWNAFSFWLGMKAFGIDLEFLAGIFTQSIVAIAVSVPSAPGFVGTFHAAAQWAVELYGIDPASGLAFATAYHLGGWIPITAIGFFYAWKLGLSFRDVGGGSSSSESEPSAAGSGLSRSV